MPVHITTKSQREHAQKHRGTFQIAKHITGHSPGRWVPLWGLWSQVTVALATATVLLQASNKMNKQQNLASNTPAWEFLLTTHQQPWSSSMLTPNSQHCNWKQLQVLSQVILVDSDQNYCVSHYGLNWTDSPYNWEPNQFLIYNRVGKTGSTGIMTASEWVTHFYSFATAFKCHNKIEDIDISPRAHRKFLVSNYCRVKLQFVSAVNSDIFCLLD